MSRIKSAWVAVTAVAVLVAASLAVGTPALALAPGDPDPSFNGGQPLKLDLAKTAPRQTEFVAVVVDSGGRYDVDGVTTDAAGKLALAMLRVLPSGATDGSFAGGGATVIQAGAGMGANLPFTDTFGLALGPGDLPVAPLYASMPDGRIGTGAARFRLDGSPDPGFGSGGIVVVQPSPMPPGYAGGSNDAVAPDGSVYVSATLEQNPTTGANREAVLAKFDSGGTLDSTTFGNGGYSIQSFSQTTDKGSYGGDLAVLPTNAVLMGGTTLGMDGLEEVVLARYLPTGQLDPTFGTTNTGYTDVQARDPAATGGYSQGNAIALSGAGSIYVAGVAVDASGRQAMSVTRFGAGGAVDTTFGSQGTKRVQVAQGNTMNGKSSAVAVRVQPDGKVVLVGTATDDGNTSYLAIVRLNTDGSLDSSFGAGGIARIQYSTATTPSTSGRGAALTPDGKLVVVGAIAGSPEMGYVQRFLLQPPAPAPAGGGGAPGPAAQPPPNAVISVVGGATTTLQGGVVVVTVGDKVACPGGDGPCDMSVLATARLPVNVVKSARVKRATVTLGSANAVVPAGTSRSVSFKLSRKGARLLRRLKRITATVKVTVRYHGLAPVTSTRTITIRQPKAKRHK